MAKKSRKNNKNLIIILAIALLGLFIIFNNPNLDTISLSSTDGINIDITQKIYPLGGYKYPLIITPQGKSMKQGDSQIFTAVNLVDAYCTNFETIYTWKKGSTIKGTGTVSHAGSINPMTSITTYNVQTESDSPIGDYSIEVQYRCDGIILGKSGCTLADSFCRGSPIQLSAKDVTSFTIYGKGGGDSGGSGSGDGSGGSGSSGGENNKLCWFYDSLSKSCSSIYQSESISCATNNRYDTEAKCKDTICIKDGGTKVCDGEDDKNKLNFDISTILIILGVALILFWAYEKYGKRK